VRVHTGVKAVRTGKKQRNKKAKREGATGAPKRPLNSCLAFRSKSHPNTTICKDPKREGGRVQWPSSILWRLSAVEMPKHPLMLCRVLQCLARAAHAENDL
jgi:hypothetical protein